MEDVRFVLHQCPFERFFRAIDIDAFTILAGRIKQRPIDSRAEVGIFEFDVGGFDGKR